MSLELAIGAVIVGLILLTIGGDKLVEGAVAIARRLGLSELFIGVALVGLGTSLPEMLATVSAVTKGQDGMALGNIIGSNIANVGLIFGAGLLLASKGVSALSGEKKDYLIMLSGLLLFSFLLLSSPAIHIWQGLLMVAALIAALGYSLRNGAENFPDQAEDEGINPPKSLVKAIAFSIVGLVALAVGAEFLVRGAVTIATTLGVPEHVIGLTLMAVGTSLPELAATIAAARQSKMTLIAGNVLGSNLFNVLGAGGIGALFGALHGSSMKWDILVMLLFSFALWPLFFKIKISPRFLAIGLLIAYTVYMFYLGRSSI